MPEALGSKLSENTSWTSAVSQDVEAFLNQYNLILKKDFVSRYLDSIDGFKKSISWLENFSELEDFLNIKNKLIDLEKYFKNDKINRIYKHNAINFYNNLYFYFDRVSAGNIVFDYQFIESNIKSLNYFIDSSLYHLWDDIKKEVKLESVILDVEQVFLNSNFYNLEINHNLNWEKVLINSWSLYILLFNIVKNAFKHGKATKTIFDIKVENWELVIEFLDDWYWIDESKFEDINDIFKFWITSWDGDGIWLWWSQEMLDSYWWMIQVFNHEWLENSKWWRWAKFTIKLPLQYEKNL